MTNTVSKFTGAVFIVTAVDNPQEIAEQVASSYFPNKEYHFTVTDATPETLPEDIRSQMTAYQRDLGYPTQILTIYPWAAKESNLPERPSNGQLPS